MTPELLDIVLAGGSRCVAIVGTAKNVGKTVTFNAIRALAFERGIVGGVTSIGRDGEASDALDGAPKPRVRIEAGTIVALPRGLVPRTPALEILDIGPPSALGPIVFGRARCGGTCEIGGPPTARGVRLTIDRLCELTSEPVFVDGAIDRMAPLAGGRGDAIVLATAPAAGESIAAVAELARATVARLTVPTVAPPSARDAFCVDGALDARDAQDLLDTRPGGTVVVSDPTKIAIRGKLLDTFMRRFDLRCLHPLRVVALTTSSAGPNPHHDPQELAVAVASTTGLPVFDVVAGLRA